MGAAEPTILSAKLADLEKRALTHGRRRADAIREANSLLAAQAARAAASAGGPGIGRPDTSRPDAKLLNTKTVSDWMTGKTHPQSFDLLGALVEVLDSWAGASRPGPLTDRDAQARRTALLLDWRHLWQRPGLVRPNTAPTPPARTHDAESLPDPAGIDARPGLNSPLPHTACFVGRARELDALDAAMASTGQAVVQAVAGLGGIGKSTLVAFWAATRLHGYAPFRWITADSPTAVRQGLADFAVELLRTTTKVHPVEALAQWAMEWLVTHNDWLVVLDNVDDPADIAPLVRRAGQGRFLITTRLATTWQNLGAGVARLGVLSEDESLDLLTRRLTSGDPRNLDGAAELCAALGHLPLALEQAAAYLEQNPFDTPRSYLKLLDSSPAEILPIGGALTAEKRTIARIWHVTLTRIAALQPFAAEVLRVVAWYAPDHIPVTLVETLDSPPTVGQALGVLNAYSMISADPGAGSFSVHRLVQAVGRLPDPTDPQRTPETIEHTRQRAVDALHKELRRTNDGADAGDALPARWARTCALVAHAAELAATIPRGTVLPNLGWLLDQAAVLADDGHWSHAVVFRERLVHDLERLYGPDAPGTLMERCRLAETLLKADDHDRALATLSDAMTRAHTALGRHDAVTLHTRLCHARALRRTEPDATFPVAMLEDVAETYNAVHGADDYRTLWAQTCLAEAWSETGNTSEAVALLERIARGYAAVNGETAWQTLSARTQLAAAWQADGRVPEAIALLRRVLDDTGSSRGPTHPDTLKTRNTLASALRAAGDTEESRSHLEAVLASGTQNALETTMARGELVAMAFEDVMSDGSRRFIDRITAIVETLVGPDEFRRQLAALDAAGEARHEQLAVDVVVRWFEENIPSAIRLKFTGFELMMADGYRLSGRLSDAAQVLERVERVLGADHPDMAAARYRLDIATHSAAGDNETVAAIAEHEVARLEADPTANAADLTSARLAFVKALPREDPTRIPLLRACVADSERLLGPTHLDTFDQRIALAWAYHTAEDFGTFRKLLLSILADAEVALGPDSYHAQQARVGLGWLDHRKSGVLKDDTITAIRASLDENIRLYGQTAPNALRVRLALGNALIMNDQPQGAIDDLTLAAHDCVRTLGDDHEITLLARTTLAHAHRCAGDFDAAIALLEEVAPQSERVRGVGHPDTLVNRNELALALLDRGEAAQALKLFLALAEPLAEITAADSPARLTLDANTAEALWYSGEHQEGIALFDAVRRARAEILGPDHHDTLYSRGMHAWAIGTAGDRARQLALLEPLIEDCTRVLGADHLRTLRAQRNQAIALNEIADARAPAACATVLADLERVYGADHFETTWFREALAT